MSRERRMTGEPPGWLRGAKGIDGHGLNLKPLGKWIPVKKPKMPKAPKKPTMRRGFR